MDFEPPSAMTRFGMFFLAGGVALIFAFWGVLNWLDKPRPPAGPVKAPPAAPAPTAPPPSPTHFPASPPPAAVPASPAPV